jgi:hypothetical protein
MGEHPLPSRSFHQGHAHFWDRVLSRRQFVTAAAAAAGGALASTTLSPLVYAAQAFPAASQGAVLPNPIPGGIQPLGPGTPIFHVFVPDPNNPDIEPSSITDFNGRIGTAEVKGSGIGTQGRIQTPLNFDCDVRFMDGVYVGVDSKKHRGTFTFI